VLSDSDSEVSVTPSWLESEISHQTTHDGGFAESHSSFRPGDRRVLNWMHGVGHGLNLAATTYSDDDDDSLDSCNTDCGYCAHADDCVCGCRAAKRVVTCWGLSVIFEEDEEEDFAVGPNSDGQGWLDQLDATLDDEALGVDDLGTNVCAESLQAHCDKAMSESPLSSDSYYGTEASGAASASDVNSERNAEDSPHSFHSPANITEPFLDSFVTYSAFPSTPAPTERIVFHEDYEADDESLDDTHTTESGTSPLTPDSAAFQLEPPHDSPSPTRAMVNSKIHDNDDSDNEDKEITVPPREVTLRRTVASMQLRKAALDQRLGR